MLSVVDNWIRLDLQAREIGEETELERALEEEREARRISELFARPAQTERIVLRRGAVQQSSLPAYDAPASAPGAAHAPAPGEAMALTDTWPIDSNILAKDGAAHAGQPEEDSPDSDGDRATPDRPDRPLL